jgi:predicted RNA-binding Zn-ribbon protein involved in translation (DUF1610 family)
MTTVTTLFALVPMAFFPGEGAELVSPIGKTVLGGLSFGSLMTLFLMPTIYFIINKKSDEREAKAEARRERIAAGLKRKDVIPKEKPAVFPRVFSCPACNKKLKAEKPGQFRCPECKNILVINDAGKVYQDKKMANQIQKGG